MSVSLAKPYAFHPAGTYLCDDNHGAWFMVVNASRPAAAILRELTDDGYALTTTRADVRNYEPLTPTDIETWQQEQARDREDREDRWSGAYWED